MKKICYVFALMITTLASCEKDLPLYNYQQNSLNFDLEIDRETKTAVEQTYSFVYADDGIESDTVWFTVNTMGFLTNYDRPFEIEQVHEEGGEVEEAQQGVHFVALDNATLKQFYVVRANKNKATFPVVVMKHASLSEKDVLLQLKVKDGEHFVSGLPQYSIAKLRITNHLTKPASWDSFVTQAYDAWGEVKHRFMIETTGLRWDNDFIADLVASGDTN